MSHLIQEQLLNATQRITNKLSRTKPDPFCRACSYQAVSQCRLRRGCLLRKACCMLYRLAECCFHRWNRRTLFATEGQKRTSNPAAWRWLAMDRHKTVCGRTVPQSWCMKYPLKCIAGDRRRELQKQKLVYHGEMLHLKAFNREWCYLVTGLQKGTFYPQSPSLQHIFLKNCFLVPTMILSCFYGDRTRHLTDHYQ